MDVEKTNAEIDRLAYAIRNTTACLQYSNHHADHQAVLKLIESIITKAQEIETLTRSHSAESTKKKEPLLCSQPTAKSSQSSFLP